MSGLKFTLSDVTSFLTDNLTGLNTWLLLEFLFKAKVAKVAYIYQQAMFFVLHVFNECK